MRWYWKIITEIQNKLEFVDYERMKNKGPEHRGWTKGWMEALIWQWNQNMELILIDDSHHRVKLK